MTPLMPVSSAGAGFVSATGRGGTGTGALLRSEGAIVSGGRRPFVGPVSLVPAAELFSQQQMLTDTGSGGGVEGWQLSAHQLPGWQVGSHLLPGGALQIIPRVPVCAFPSGGGNSQVTPPTIISFQSFNREGPAASSNRTSQLVHLTATEITSTSAPLDSRPLPVQQAEAPSPSQSRLPPQPPPLGGGEEVGDSSSLHIPMPACLNADPLDEYLDFSASELSSFLTQLDSTSS